VCCRSRLTDSLRLLTSHLSDVKTRAKRLNAVRQSRQNELYTIQQNIREHSEQIVARIRQREATLLLEAQSMLDSGLNVDGCGSLAELEFRKSEIEKLIGDVRQLLAGPPVSCLLYFDDVSASVCRLTDASLHGAAASSSRLRTPKPVRFVPASPSDMNIIIGSLQDCSFGSVDMLESEEPQSPSTTGSPPHSSADHSASGGRKRTASILNSLSPARKCDLRGYRIKSVVRRLSSPSDSVVAASSSVVDVSVPTGSPSCNSVAAGIESTPTSPSRVPGTASLTRCVALTCQARILFNISQVRYTQTGCPVTYTHVYSRTKQ